MKPRTTLTLATASSTSMPNEPAIDASPSPPKRQFSLAQLFAIVLAVGVFLAAGRTLSHASLAPVAEWALVIAGFVAATAVLAATRKNGLAGFTAFWGALFTLIAFLIPAISTSQQLARRFDCENRLKQIVVALHTYHGAYGSFPPAVVRDQTGRPMHSWRVLLLPYLEQQDLYAKYRFDEPWDGPNNRKLHVYGLPYNKCPANDSTGPEKSDTETSYVVVGPKTAFPGEKCVALSDITDDKGNTILVVEVANSGIHWMEPRDLHVTQMARQINPTKGQGISSKHKSGANVAMADGSVQFLDAEKLTPTDLENLLSINGGESPPQK